MDRWAEVWERALEIRFGRRSSQPREQWPGQEISLRHLLMTLYPSSRDRGGGPWGENQLACEGYAPERLATTGFGSASLSVDGDKTVSRGAHAVLLSIHA